MFAGCLHATGPDALKLKDECSNRLRILQLDVTKDKEIEAAKKEVKSTLTGKSNYVLCIMLFKVTV